MKPISSYAYKSHKESNAPGIIGILKGDEASQVALISINWKEHSYRLFVDDSGDSASINIPEVEFQDSQSSRGTRRVGPARWVGVVA